MIGNSFDSPLARYARPFLALGTALAVAFSLFGPSVCFAVPLVPGANALAVGEPDPTGGAVVATLTAPFASATFNGTLVSKVIAGDPSNPLGGLTFTYFLTNNLVSANNIERLTVDGYTGWGTDVSYQTPVPPGNVPPTFNDRDATGNVMGFTFQNPVVIPGVGVIGNGVLAPGDTAALMVIQTNAPSFQPTIANVIDGAVTAMSSYAPAAVIPEPSTLVLAALGALGLAVAGRRWMRATE